MHPLRLILTLFVTAFGLQTQAVSAQNLPNKPVRIIVPFAAGGAVDVLARLVGAKLQEAFHQPVIVENRPGAGGNLGADLVAKSSPDGTTILLTPNGQAISPSLYRNLPYDGRNDLTPVTQLVASNLVLVASPKSSVTSVRDLIAQAKANPGKLNYGSSGVGNPLHLTMEMFKHQMLADEPVAAGGENSGPGPYDFVLAGLGACTSMTMRLYADRNMSRWSA